MRADNRQMDKVTSIGRFESKTSGVKKGFTKKGNIHTFCIYDWIYTFYFRHFPQMKCNFVTIFTADDMI